MSRPRPTDPIGSIGWTERTGGVLTAPECLSLAGPLLRGELGILVGRLAMALRLHSGRRSSVDPASLEPPDSSLARDADVVAYDLLTPAGRYARLAQLRIYPGARHDALERARDTMRAITYSRLGDPSVLELVERPIPEPEEGEVRIRVAVSGVNPTDWKSRSGMSGGALGEPTVPNHDGSGVVDELGAGVTGYGIGDRVWVTLAGHGRPASGTAQDYTVVPAERAFPLPEAADFELGASVGIPAVTAHRALTVAEDGPARLHPDALRGRIVLVAGGAGAVGNSAIQLARWAGATVIATVSGEAKGKLATAAGAHHVLNYKESDTSARIRNVAPDGIDVIVEVAAGTNAELDLAALRPRGTISVYANDGGAPFNVDVRRNMGLNARYQFVLVYTVGWERIAAAAADINRAIEDGAFRVGEDAGLPLHRFGLEDTSAAHAAVESGAVGKVLITVASE